MSVLVWSFILLEFSLVVLTVSEGNINHLQWLHVHSMYYVDCTRKKIDEEIIELLVRSSTCNLY
jgi:hypothetical protein